MEGSIETYLLLGLLLSVVGSLGAVLLVGTLLVKVPADYFCDFASSECLPRRHPLVRRTLLFLKNVLGATLLVAGVVLAVPGIPGPGIPTILIGLLLLDFRGKRQLERRVISQPVLMRAINGLRRRYGKPPLTCPSSRERA